jgi:hypothetical protein
LYGLGRGKSYDVVSKNQEFRTRATLFPGLPITRILVAKASREMPLSGGWSGCGSNHVKLEPVPFVHFPVDKEIRDHVHARLAKKIAAREARKAAEHGQKGN